MTQNSAHQPSYRRTTPIVLAGLAVEIITVLVVGQLIFGVVFDILHPNTNDFWQNLVTLAVAVILTLIVGGLAFALVSGIYYGVVYDFGPPKREGEGRGA
jgi:hypothetical protein